MTLGEMLTRPATELIAEHAAVSMPGDHVGVLEFAVKARTMAALEKIAESVDAVSAALDHGLVVRN